MCPVKVKGPLMKSLKAIAFYLLWWSAIFSSTFIPSARAGFERWTVILTFSYLVIFAATWTYARTDHE